MANEEARQKAISLWDDITKAVSTAIDRRVDRRRVVDIDDDGVIWVEPLDPEVDSRDKAPRIRGVRVDVGDDVLLMSIGGVMTIIGAVRMAGDDPTESEVPAHTHNADDIEGLNINIASIPGLQAALNSKSGIIYGQRSGSASAFVITRIVSNNIADGILIYENPNYPGHAHLEVNYDRVATRDHQHNPNSNQTVAWPWAPTHNASAWTTPRIPPGTEHWALPQIGTGTGITRLGSHAITSGGITWWQFHSHANGICWINSAHVVAR